MTFSGSVSLGEKTSVQPAPLSLLPESQLGGTAINPTFVRISNIMRIANGCIENKDLAAAQECLNQIPIGPYFDQFRDAIIQNLVEDLLKRGDYKPARMWAEEAIDPYLMKTLISKAEQIVSV